MYDAQLQALDERQVKGSAMSFRYYRPDRWVDDRWRRPRIRIRLSHECAEGMVGEGGIAI
jgi:hypothetical protein